MNVAQTTDLKQPAKVRKIGNEPALTVKDLRVYYDTPNGKVKAVDGVSFVLRRGERLGLVGESGSGKTTMATAIMRMTKPPAFIASGEIILDSKNLLQLSEQEMNGVRLSELALVPQGAMNSMNPVMRVGEQIRDGVIDHVPRGKKRPTRNDIQGLILNLLEGVGLDPAVARMFPHELSGGMKQRAVMAISTALKPQVIVADEPTSALDVVVQRQIITTLENLQNELGASVILVGHDMGLMAQFADRLGVMYAGELVELSPVDEIFDNPVHPYTKLLISSLPSLGGKKEFMGIPGLPPALINPPSGCYFHPRCPSVMEQCKVKHPNYAEVEPNRFVACHLFSPMKHDEHD